MVPKIVKQYKAFFGKLIKVGKDKKYVILYFNNDRDLFNAVTESTLKEKLGEGLMIKCQDELIGLDGKFKRFVRTTPKDNKSADVGTTQQIKDVDAGSNSDDEEHFSDALENSEAVSTDQTTNSNPKSAGSTSQIEISQKDFKNYKDLNKGFTDRLLQEQEGTRKVPILIETQEEDDRPGAKTVKRRIAEVKKTKK